MKHIIAVVLILFCGVPLLAADNEYQQGTLVSAGHETHMYNDPLGGLVGPNKSGPYEARMIVVRVGDVLYTAQGKGTAKLGEWVVGDTVELRFINNGKRFMMRRPNGKDTLFEVKTRERVKDDTKQN